jgi:hypothetical protein
MGGTVWSVTEAGYLDAHEASVLVFHNSYPAGKQGGVELIHHGERVATCGMMRVSPAGGGWAGYPRAGEREADAEAVRVAVPLEFRSGEMKHRVAVAAEGESVRLSVVLDEPLEPDAVASASFVMELYPPAYWGRTFRVGEASGTFPRESASPVVRGDDGAVRADPFGHGPRIVIASEDPERRLMVEGVGCELALTDPRGAFEESWFTLSTPVPVGASGTVVEWLLTLHRIEGWRRRPVVGVSQVGYHPAQAKRAVIELDRAWEEPGSARLLRIEADGGMAEALCGPVERWGPFLRYEYGIFDFSEVREPGLYLVEFGGVTEGPFRIGADVYATGVWQPTLTRFFPIQMCHMRVASGGSVAGGGHVWHGACHLDDALQAPTSHEHFDGYRQGECTDTPFEPHQHIPGLDVGGWHDAGDTDLAAGSQARTTHALVLAREEFGADCDETTVLWRERLALIGVPDGAPDVLHQIAHGVQCLLGGYRACGHSFCGIIGSSRERYHQRGSLSTMSDNLVYDAALAEDEVRDGRSGRMDDRWAFTNRDTSLEYQVAAALAASARVLAGYDEALAEECIETARTAWEFEHTHAPAEHRCAYVPGRAECQEVIAAVELFLTTGEERYGGRLAELLPVVEEHVGRVGWAAARAASLLGDESFERALREALAARRDELRAELAANPYGVIYRPQIWGIAWNILDFAVGHYYLVRRYPDLFEREDLLAVVNYVLGCHPGSNASLVSGVGRRSQTVAFGITRADWSYVPGGVISGPALIRPDFPELKDGFPFLWQQSEYVMSGAGTYVFCVLAADALLRDSA